MQRRLRRPQVGLGLALRVARARRARAGRSRARRASRCARPNSLCEYEQRASAATTCAAARSTSAAYGAGSIVISRSPFLTSGAFAEVHRLHRAGDARADVDALDRFEAGPENSSQVATSLGCDGRDRDRGGGRRGRRWRAVRFCRLKHGGGDGGQRGQQRCPRSRVGVGLRGSWKSWSKSFADRRCSVRRAGNSAASPAARGLAGAKSHWMTGTLYFVVNATTCGRM